MRRIRGGEIENGLRLASVPVLGALLALALVLGSCGGGGSSSGSSDSASISALQKAKIGDPQTIKSFLGPQGKKQLAGYAGEGSRPEFEEAAVVVAESLEARAASDWSGQCETLSEAASEKVVANSGKSCADALGALASKATPEILEDNMQDGVVALAIKGDKGYALFWGKQKRKWAMPIEKDGAEWKVASIVAVPLPAS